MYTKQFSAHLAKLKPASALMALTLLAACNSSNTSDALSSAKQEKSQDDFVDLRAYCPKTVVRAGTETMRVFPKGVKSDAEGANKLLRFQATIQEVVRECNYIAETLSMRVGVAGRVINGPSGEAGTIELPIRIAVTRGDEVLYSQLHKISANLDGGKNYATFRFVDSAVTIDKPAKQNISVQIGFDEGPYNTP